MDIPEQPVHKKKRKPTADGEQSNKKAKETTKLSNGGKEKLPIAEPNKKVQKLPIPTRQRLFFQLFNPRTR